MSGTVALLILAVAALLEAGGDAIVRSGLHASTFGARAGLILLGGAVLLVYGLVVNAPPWDFGRLLGVYVTLFFVAAQVIGYAAFGIIPSVPILVGGGLVAAGGLLMTFWH